MSQSVFDVFPGRVAVTPAEAGHAVFGWTAKTVRNRLLAASFPFPVVTLAGRRVVRLADLENALVGASAPTKQDPPPQLKRKPGRPRKMLGG
jgi:hypothetical protein